MSWPPFLSLILLPLFLVSARVESKRNRRSKPWNRNGFRGLISRDYKEWKTILRPTWFLSSFRFVNYREEYTTAQRTINYLGCSSIGKESGEQSLLSEMINGGWKLRRNFHIISCLTDLINFHPCLTRSKETQKNSHINSCLSTRVNFHLCLTKSKESQNMQLSYKLLSINSH